MSGVRVDVLARDVGARIAELRRLRGLTQAQLGERVDASDKHLQRVEAGQENLTLRTLAAYADALDVEVATLFRPPLVVDRRRGRPRRAPAPADVLAEGRLAYGLPGDEGGAHGRKAAAARLVRLTPERAGGPLVPLLTLLAVDGPPGAVVDAGIGDFVELVGRRREPGQFVARLLGEPLGPTVPSGALALFRTRLPTPPDGAIVLAATAEDTRAARYRLRRLAIVAREPAGLVRARLEPLGRGGKPSTVTLGPGAESRLVGALVELVAGAPAQVA